MRSLWVFPYNEAVNKWLLTLFLVFAGLFVLMSGLAFAGAWVAPYAHPIEVVGVVSFFGSLFLGALMAVDSRRKQARRGSNR